MPVLLLSVKFSQLFHELVEAGFDLNCQSAYGITVLMHSCQKRDTDLTRFLFSKNVDVLKQDCNLNSALHFAAKSGFDEAINVLIERGADVFGKNIQGNTPLDLAITFKHEECIRLLRKFESACEKI